MRSTDDDQLLQAVAAGEPHALEECIERFGRLVWSLARQFLRNDADAEEAVQDVFAELWAHADRFDPARSSEASFVAMIARRRLIDRTRREQRRAATETVTMAFDVPSEPQSDDVEAADDLERVRAAVGQLEPKVQRVLKLAVYHGLSHQRVAEVVGAPLGTVKTHIRRGLIKVRKILGHEQPESLEGRS